MGGNLVRLYRCTRGGTNDHRRAREIECRWSRATRPDIPSCGGTTIYTGITYIYWMGPRRQVAPPYHLPWSTMLHAPYRFLLLQIIYLHFQMILEESWYYANAMINILGRPPNAIFQLSRVLKLPAASRHAKSARRAVWCSLGISGSCTVQIHICWPRNSSPIEFFVNRWANSNVNIKNKQ